MSLRLQGKYSLKVRNFVFAVSLALCELKPMNCCRLYEVYWSFIYNQIERKDFKSVWTTFRYILCINEVQQHKLGQVKFLVPRFTINPQGLAQGKPNC